MRTIQIIYNGGLSKELDRKLRAIGLLMNWKEYACGYEFGIDARDISFDMKEEEDK